MGPPRPQQADGQGSLDDDSERDSKGEGCQGHWRLRKPMQDEHLVDLVYGAADVRIKKCGVQFVEDGEDIDESHSGVQGSTDALPELPPVGLGGRTLQHLQAADQQAAIDQEGKHEWFAAAGRSRDTRAAWAQAKLVRAQSRSGNKKSSSAKG